MVTSCSNKERVCVFILCEWEINFGILYWNLSPWLKVYFKWCILKTINNIMSEQANIRQISKVYCRIYDIES